MSPAQMTAHVRNNDVALERSPLWLDGDGRLIGLGLVGLRGRQAWIGGLGIVPAWRGRGLARSLIEACLDNARATGASGVELEVLVGKDRAKRSYECADFRETGRLIGVRGEIPAGAASARVIGAARLLERPLRATCLRATCWQRARPSLARIAELEAVWLDHAFLCSPARTTRSRSAIWQPRNRR